MIKLIKYLKCFEKLFFSLYNLISKLFKRSGGAANAVNRSKLSRKIEQEKKNFTSPFNACVVENLSSRIRTKLQW